MAYRSVGKPELCPSPLLQEGLLWALGTETWALQLFIDRTIIWNPTYHQRSCWDLHCCLSRPISEPSRDEWACEPNLCLSIAHLWQPRAVQLCTHTTEHPPRWHWALLLLSKALCPADDNPFWVPAPYLLVSSFLTISGLLSPFSNTQLQLELTACLVPSACLRLLWPQL